MRIYSPKPIPEEAKDSIYVRSLIDFDFSNMDFLPCLELLTNQGCEDSAVAIDENTLQVYGFILVGKKQLIDDADFINNQHLYPSEFIENIKKLNGTYIIGCQYPDRHLRRRMMNFVVPYIIHYQQDFVRVGGKYEYQFVKHNDRYVWIRTSDPVIVRYIRTKFKFQQLEHNKDLYFLIF